MMSSAQTATAVHEADAAAKALFPPDLPALHLLAVRILLRLDRAPSVDVLLDLLASCDRDIFSETVAAHGFDPLAAS